MGADAELAHTFCMGLNPGRSAHAGPGRVGETLNGYLVALKNDAETQKLVLDINHARRASYQQLADSNHLPVDEVAKMAGQKLVERARPGEYVQGINGKWMRK